MSCWDALVLLMYQWVFFNEKTWKYHEPSSAPPQTDHEKLMNCVKAAKTWEFILSLFGQICTNKHLLFRKWFEIGFSK